MGGENGTRTDIDGVRVVLNLHLFRTKEYFTFKGSGKVALPFF